MIASVQHCMQWRYVHQQVQVKRWYLHRQNIVNTAFLLKEINPVPRVKMLHIKVIKKVL